MGAMNSFDDTGVFLPKNGRPFEASSFWMSSCIEHFKICFMRYCPFLLKTIFSYLIFLDAVVSAVFPSISSFRWFFVCLKMVVSKPKLRDIEQVRSSWTLKPVMLLHSVLPYHLPTLVLFWF